MRVLSQEMKGIKSLFYTCKLYSDAKPCVDESDLSGHIVLIETVRTDSSNLRFCQRDASSAPFPALSRLKNRLRLINSLQKVVSPIR